VGSECVVAISAHTFRCFLQFSWCRHSTSKCPSPHLRMPPPYTLGSLGQLYNLTRRASQSFHPQSVPVRNLPFEVMAKAMDCWNSCEPQVGVASVGVGTALYDHVSVKDYPGMFIG